MEFYDAFAGSHNNCTLYLCDFLREYRIFYIDYYNCNTHVSSSLVPPPRPTHRTTTTPTANHAADGYDIPEPDPTPDRVHEKTDHERPAGDSLESISGLAHAQV